MKDRGTVPEQATTGEVVDVVGAVIEQVSPLLKRMTSDEIRALTGSKGRFGRAFRQALTPGVKEPPSPEEVVEDWRKFYRLVFGAKFVPEAVQIPEVRGDFTRVLIVPKGLTLNRMFGVCKELFGAWSDRGDDLDRAITVNDRTATEYSYAVLVRDRVEADEELKDLSAVELAERKISGIALAERLLYEVKYYGETGEHLDWVKATLCIGSRGSGGSVPGVSWSDGGLGVDGYGPRDAGPSLRARAVVSGST